MIYFVSDGEYVKIGHTARDDVRERIADLQTGNARKLHLLGTIEGGLETEAVLHYVFAPLRVHGEWFSILPEAVAEAQASLKLSARVAFDKDPNIKAANLARQLGAVNKIRTIQCWLKEWREAE